MQSGIAQQHTRLGWIAVFFLLNSLGLGFSIEIPKTFENLSSSEFQKRESAQADLLEWARQVPEPAMAELFKQSRIAKDPEVRERCIEILKSLVGDEYSREGEGYIGIALADEILKVPGEGEPRNVIRVTEVRGDTPGMRAGIQLNDLILGLNGKDWLGVEGSTLFREQIKAMKPESSARLKILRDGKLIDLKVILGRRPLAADMLFNGFNLDMEAAEKAAKEAHFNRWLLQMKSKN